MKKYAYELTYLDQAYDYRYVIGFFTSLGKIRQYIGNSQKDPDMFDCFRHPLNPEGDYDTVQVLIFRE